LKVAHDRPFVLRDTYSQCLAGPKGDLPARMGGVEPVPSFLLPADSRRWRRLRYGRAGGSLGYLRVRSLCNPKWWENGKNPPFLVDRLARERSYLDDEHPLAPMLDTAMAKTESFRRATNDEQRSSARTETLQAIDAYLQQRLAT
jgi:hypothetical protein